MTVMSQLGRLETSDLTVRAPELVMGRGFGS
jgi:hypothetical protein